MPENASWRLLVIRSKPVATIPFHRIDPDQAPDSQLSESRD
jgi:hypothetical protein